MRKKLVAGNWKMHGSLAENAALLAALKPALAGIEAAGAIVVCDGPVILPEHLPASVTCGAAAAAPAGPAEPLLTLEALERRHIEATLRSMNGHRGNAARSLGISERNLYRKLREYGLLT